MFDCNVVCPDIVSVRLRTRSAARTNSRPAAVETKKCHTDIAHMRSGDHFYLQMSMYTNAIRNSDRHFFGMK